MRLLSLKSQLEYDLELAKRLLSDFPPESAEAVCLRQVVLGLETALKAFEPQPKKVELKPQKTVKGERDVGAHKSATA